MEQHEPGQTPGTWIRLFECFNDFLRPVILFFPPKVKACHQHESTASILQWGQNTAKLFKPSGDGCSQPTDFGTKLCHTSKITHERSRRRPAPPLGITELWPPVTQQHKGGILLAYLLWCEICLWEHQTAACTTDNGRSISAHSLCVSPFDWFFTVREEELRGCPTFWTISSRQTRNDQVKVDMQRGSRTPELRRLSKGDSSNRVWRKDLETTVFPPRSLRGRGLDIHSLTEFAGFSNIVD